MRDTPTCEGPGARRAHPPGNSAATYEAVAVGAACPSAPQYRPTSSAAASFSSRASLRCLSTKVIPTPLAAVPTNETIPAPLVLWPMATRTMPQRGRRRRRTPLQKRVDDRAPSHVRRPRSSPSRSRTGRTRRVQERVPSNVAPSWSPLYGWPNRTIDPTFDINCQATAPIGFLCRRPKRSRHDDQPGHSSRTVPARDSSPSRSGRRDGCAGDGRPITR